MWIGKCKEQQSGLCISGGDKTRYYYPHVPKHSRSGSVPSQPSNEDDQALRHHASTQRGPHHEPAILYNLLVEKHFLVDFDHCWVLRTITQMVNNCSLVVESSFLLHCPVQMLWMLSKEAEKPAARICPDRITITPRTFQTQIRSRSLLHLFIHSFTSQFAMHLHSVLCLPDCLPDSLPACLSAHLHDYPSL